MRRTSLLILMLVCSIHFGYPQHKDHQKIKDRITKLQSQNDFNVKDTTYINLLNKYSGKMRYINEDSLLLLATQALEHSKSAEYKNGHSEALFRIGDYYSDKGKNAKAIEKYNEAWTIAQEINNDDLKLRILNNLSSEYGYKGDIAKALNGYLKALELAEEKDNKQMLSILNENIASLFASQHDFEDALIYYKKVKKINDELNDELINAETFSNLASLYADMEELDYAMFYINKSTAIFEKNSSPDWLAFAYETKGKIYLKQKKYKWALYWYDQSNILHKTLNDTRGKIDLYNGMAEAYLGQGKDILSEKYAQEAFNISNEIDFLEGKQKCARTLYIINKNKNKFATALSYHEIYQELSDTLSRSENQKSLTMLQVKDEHDHMKMELIQENERALAKQQNYVNAALAILLIFIAITILVHRGQKIQKKLNAELQSKQEILENRETALSESNETKTKLFSIIGHDLRGPIGALQGLLKMFKDGEISQKDFLEFIPKLRDDVDHIFFTLNNLLSWGYTQMNGAVTKPSVVDIEALVDMNVNLLSEIAEKKSIKIVSEIAANTLTWSDSDQIDIVIRNLISNALKFTPESGIVTIRSEQKQHHWEISVMDTGVGMDKVTQEKLFSKNANITTYGTNNEKGTGLGLSLCKEMVEKNNGTIWVNSNLRTGSTFYFTLPKAEKEKNYSKAS
ncbi:tetratricopeptide repeat-containing sensor histidine kinase [Muriicola sp. Z0-33]|uniref:tetratricopeptide repeat-containing sensor histidine kinase n=1 Tax=Muriicola sp. Z0-33 TaxID=2816957 RepID=UPI002236F97B|nr:tetratricopeptide repeat-containing sensor histidine kinase [Muriicola sp. Z0-33]